MKKLIIVLIILLLGGAGAYYYLRFGKVEEKATVTQAQIQQGDVVQFVEATGTLEALRNVQVGSQVSGFVKNLYADFNQIVHEGQILAEIDPTLLQVQVQVQEANIARQEGDIAQQRVTLENDEVNLKRAQAQAAKGLVSPQQLETSELQVKARKAQITAAEKNIIQAKANLDQAKLNVSYCTIRSPIDGVIVERRVDIGSVVQASMTTPQFFLIATDLTTLKLSAGVDEADIGLLRRGMPVTFFVDTYPQVPFTGEVDAVRLNATTQQNVVTYPVWINVKNDDYRLKPSMTARVRIIVDQAANVLKVPNQALRFRPTTDMYTWLGMTPPAAGKGRGANVDAGRGGDPAQVASKGGAMAPGGAAKKGGNQQADANAAQGGGRRQRGQDQGGGQGGNRQAQGGLGQGRGQSGDAQAGNAQGGRGGRGGFGRGGANLTPEQMAEFAQRFGGAGGRGGRNAGGNAAGGRGGQPMAGNAAPASPTPRTAQNAERIDDLFAPVPKRIQPGQVWLYDDKATDPNRKLRQVSIRIGLTDGTTSELVSSSEPLTVGSMVVTGVIPPPSALPKAGTNIFQQNRGGFGPQPGGGGDRGGGGAPRGGGGGGGRGGD